VQAFDPVEHHVQGELELELVVAARPDDRVLVVVDRSIQLIDRGEHPAELLEHLGLERPILIALIVEQLLGETDHAAAQRVHHVVGQVDREAAVGQHPDHRIHVGHHRHGGP